jgi:hypothetical protein
MQPGQQACSCPECGVVCRGLFEGCGDVWARGPRPVAVKPDGVVNAAAPAAVREPVAVAKSAPAPRAARQPESERARRAGASRAVPNPDSVRRANAARVKAERASAQAGAEWAPERRGPLQDDAPIDDPRRASSAPAGAPGNGFSDHVDSPGPTDSNGHTVNGRRAALGAGSPPSASGDPRSDVLRWFDDAFTSLRREMREVIGGLTRQQAMITELMDARQADLRLVVVAEGLPDVVQDAVRAAVGENTGQLASTLDAALREMSRTVRNAERASTRSVNQLRRALQGTERSATEALEEARLLRADADEREARRAKALKAEVTRQLKPLAEATAASERRLDEIMARLDSLAPRAATKKPPAATKNTPAPKKAAPKKTLAKKTAAKKTPAKKAPLDARRQPLLGVRPVGERS